MQRYREYNNTVFACLRALLTVERNGTVILMFLKPKINCVYELG